MKQRLKRFVFGLLGKDPEAAIVSFWSGDDELASAMVAEIRRLEPKRRHFVVTLGTAEIPGVTMMRLHPGNAWSLFGQARKQLSRYRIGLAPVLIASAPHPLRLTAFLLAPFRVLAYNARLERHHLKPTDWLASSLFLSGVERDRIYLRPDWLTPWRKPAATANAWPRVLEGRPLSSRRKRVAVLSPYVPYPLSHGGAVRIFNLLRESSVEFDIFLFAFAEHAPAFGRHREVQRYEALLEFCAKVILAPKPRYREPRWSTLLPPEVHEYESAEMRVILDSMRREFAIPVLQVEYTQLARYRGDILVEHDITFDLFRQVFRDRRTPMNWWNYFRWRCFEEQAFWNFPAIVAMSRKDVRLLADPQRGRVVENGVDLERFVPRGEGGGGKLLFIGSFRHFPNVTAYRFMTERIWPLLLRRLPGAQLTCIAGPEFALHWARFAGQLRPPDIPGVRLLGFVEDVRPAYADTNVVVVPTTVSAGTNVKVLEAMAMERAVVSTSSGCAGLELTHGENIWIADEPEAFAEGVGTLLENFGYRSRLARTAREHVELHYGWEALGHKQRALFREMSKISEH
ncbi:MAG: glycosyltransferase family 4 protein [Acidobacteriota bacterium]|nr:glycosyltransferase family 4 protein [Acidobacteriota bacterium]